MFAMRAKISDDPEANSVPEPERQCPILQRLVHGGRERAVAELPLELLVGAGNGEADRLCKADQSLCTGVALDRLEDDLPGETEPAAGFDSLQMRLLRPSVGARV